MARPTLAVLLVALVAILAGCGTFSSTLDSAASPSPGVAAPTPEPERGVPGAASSRDAASEQRGSLAETVPPDAATQVESPFSALPDADKPLALFAADSRLPEPLSPGVIAGRETSAGSDDGDRATGMAQARETP